MNASMTMHAGRRRRGTSRTAAGRTHSGDGALDALVAGADLIGVVEAVLAGRASGVDRRPGRDVHDLGGGAEPASTGPRARSRGEGRQMALVGPALDQLGVGAVEADAAGPLRGVPGMLMPSDLEPAQRRLDLGDLDRRGARGRSSLAGLDHGDRSRCCPRRAVSAERRRSATASRRLFKQRGGAALADMAARRPSGTLTLRTGTGTSAPPLRAPEDVLAVGPDHSLLALDPQREARSGARRSVPRYCTLHVAEVDQRLGAAPCR